jgi:[acyl-carrier-protein] S-malonyltransferase
MRVFVYPGQGSQHIGMGQEFYQSFLTAREVFQEVDETLKEKLSHLMFSGDESTLKLTEHAQPAMMTVSMAIMRVLEKDCGFGIQDSLSFMAGHSLGEYSAYCASKSLSLAQTAKLLKVRGRAMQSAVPNGIGGMAALLNVDLNTATDIAREACQTSEVCEVANENAPGQIVISGHLSAVERAVGLAKDKGAKRAIMLPVSAPFHCSLMQPAVKTMQEALDSTEFLGDPQVPVIANVTATPIHSCQEIKSCLIEQITGRVRWVETIQYMVQNGIKEIVEIGSGKVLSGLIKRIDSNVSALNIETPADLDLFMKVHSA